MKKIAIIFILLIAFVSLRAQIHIPKKDTITTEQRQYDLNPITVTGEGHHQRVSNTITPVHVITADELKEQGLSTFENALTNMLPQVSLAPSSMGSMIRFNGLSNKYVLIMVNGRRLNGDISDNIDLNRINLSRVKRIEVLDGAASTLYGSDAIGGVINIITEEPTSETISLTNDVRVSGEGVYSHGVNLDVYSNGFGSYTSFKHDEADSYRINPLIYVTGSDTETQQTLAPLYTGYSSDLFTQKFTYTPNKHLSFNAGIEGFWKTTDRPETNPDITGGTDYEMRYRGLKWNVGGIYKFNKTNSLQADFTYDRFRYGKFYDVATDEYALEEYIQSKKQKMLEAEIKAILATCKGGTTVVGVDWIKNYLTTTSGNVDEDVYSSSAYLQHEQKIASILKATAGLRYTYHETFGSYITPKIGFIMSPGLFNFRVSYSRGYRSPGIDELYYHYYSLNRGKAQVSFGNMDLTPETSDYISVGAEFRSDKITVNVTGFLNYIDNMITKASIELDDDSRQMLLSEFEDLTKEQAEAMTSYSRYINSDKGRVKGLSTNVSANIFSGFNLSIGYALIYAQTQTDGVWEMLDRTVKNTGTISASYRHTWEKYTLYVNINGRLQSETYYSAYENAPGYGIWNINTSHKFICGNFLEVEPSIGIDNIFNRVDDRIDSSLRKYALYSPGRMLTVGLRMKFK